MQQQSLTDEMAEFLRTYYHDEVRELARLYPGDKKHLDVAYGDLYQSAPDVAAMLCPEGEGRADPESVIGALEDAIPRLSVPVDVTMNNVEVRITGLDDGLTLAPGEIRSDDPGTYCAVRGTLERVTTTSDLPVEMAFECQRCGTVAYIPQSPTADELHEPTECAGCERQGPWRVAEQQSDWTDYVKVRIQSRPDVDPDAEGKLPGFVTGDLIDTGGEAGLLGRVGEPVVVSGIIRRTQKSGRGVDEKLFDHVMDVRAVEFERDDDTVDVAAHRDEFEALAAEPNAVDLFAESIAPQLHATDAWDAAMEFAVAYLFGAPRIDIPQGPTYRGDLHFLMVSDYGTGKSTFKQEVEAFSPKCIAKSTTALSSDVGLTAAAVKDDFGEGQWTIKPGLLVRANGGHLILDEIDKGPDELTAMNDALEGEQVVDIEKAGQSATYQSRTAVMALGNPVDGRFNEHEPIAEQLGIAESLLSRFDGIVTMSDTADREQDAAVADTWGRAFTEAQAAEYGEDDEFDTLDRPVPIDVGRAWIQYARENVTPRLTFEQFTALKDWYAEEVRQLNHTYAGDGEGSDMPVPATVRKLAATTKMAIAFARANLRDEVAAEDIERAKKLGKRLVKQNWDGEKFSATKDHRSPTTQEGRVEAVAETLRDADEPLTPAQVASRVDIDESTAEDQLTELARKGEVVEPETGCYRDV